MIFVYSTMRMRHLESLQREQKQRLYFSQAGKNLVKDFTLRTGLLYIVKKAWLPSFLIQAN